VFNPEKVAASLEWLERFINNFEAALSSIGEPVPRWDSDSLTLSYGEIICRHYKRRNAKNQVAVLDAFQNANWPRSVDSPFKLDRTLREAIDKLNQGLAELSPIHFAVEHLTPVWIRPGAPGRSG
jgi:hypothetical protein